MNKYLSFLLAVLLTLSLAAPSRAESLGRLHQNEVAVSYGQFSFPQTIYVIGAALGATFSLGNFKPQDTRMLGQFGLEYTHWVGRWVGLGLLATGDHMTATVNEGQSSDYTLTVFSAVPTVKLSWFNYEHVGMYSKIGIGVSDYVGGDPVHQFTLAFQLSPVCVDFGGAHFRGFVELGYGVQGPCGGIKYVF